MSETVLNRLLNYRARWHGTRYDSCRGKKAHLITRCERMFHAIESQSGSENSMSGFPFTEEVLFPLAVLIQIVGIVSLVLARLGESRSSFRRVFVAGLVVVGSCTMLAVGFGSGYWFSFAVTFSIMFIGATIDFRPLDHVRSI